MVYGIDIIRAYELSWLNQKGKPQLAVLELQQECSQPAINTWELKNYLESINNTVIADINALTNNFPNSAVKIIQQKDFAVIDFFENSKKIKQTYKQINQGLRFICQKTGQPYIGIVNLCLDSSSSLAAETVAKLLTGLRNKEYIPKTFVAELYSLLLTKIQENFVLSVHLNRRGGVSYQSLRASKPQDFSVLSCRSVLE